MKHIPFNRPFFTGNELDYIRRSIEQYLHTSGNGHYTRKAQALLEQKYGYRKVLLTTSCTDALEMTALLADLGPDDEVIVPSYTFVSTANAFLLRNARLRFADSTADFPNIDPDHVESLITPRTRAIVIVHYAGVACPMDRLREIAQRHQILLIEDAAQAIGAFYNDEPLGGIGDFGTLSFHETKNIISGEGGALIINRSEFIDRAEILWEKGTNRAAFQRGEVQKYEWVDVGSSFLPSDIIAAFLYAQLEKVDEINAGRLRAWHYYHQRLTPLEQAGHLRLPHPPAYARHNGHLFYILLADGPTRDRLIDHLYRHGVRAVFHYLPLHKSPLARRMGYRDELPHAERYGRTLLRLPLYHQIAPEDQDRVIDALYQFFQSSSA